MTEEVYFIPKSVLDSIFNTMDPHTRTKAENHWLSAPKRFQLDQIKLSRDMIDSMLKVPSNHCGFSDYHKVVSVLDREMTLLAYLHGTNMTKFLSEQKLGVDAVHGLLCYREDDKNTPMDQNKAEITLRMFVDLFDDFLEENSRNRRISKDRYE